MTQLVTDVQSWWHYRRLFSTQTIIGPGGWQSARDPRTVGTSGTEVPAYRPIGSGVKRGYDVVCVTYNTFENTSATELELRHKVLSSPRWRYQASMCVGI